jgi:hypothetical protein
MLLAAATPAIVHVDQVSAVRAGARRDLLAQERFRADRSHVCGVRLQIDTVSFAISLRERLHALARALRAIRAGEISARLYAGAHDALASVCVRLGKPRAAARARILVQVPVAEHAV